MHILQTLDDIIADLPKWWVWATRVFIHNLRPVRPILLHTITITRPIGSAAMLPRNLVIYQGPVFNAELTQEELFCDKFDDVQHQCRAISTTDEAIFNDQPVESLTLPGLTCFRWPSCVTHTVPTLSLRLVVHANCIYLHWGASHLKWKMSITRSSRCKSLEKSQIMLRLSGVGNW